MSVASGLLEGAFGPDFEKVIVERIVRDELTLISAALCRVGLDVRFDSDIEDEVRFYKRQPSEWTPSRRLQSLDKYVLCKKFGRLIYCRWFIQPLDLLELTRGASDLLENFFSVLEGEVSWGRREEIRVMTAMRDCERKSYVHEVGEGKYFLMNVAIRPEDFRIKETGFVQFGYAPARKNELIWQSGKIVIT